MERIREAIVVFTTVLTGLDGAGTRCYVCTTIDANAMLKEIADPNWLRWLENVRYAPYSEQCADDFKVDLALRGGVKNHECSQGVCMKMVIQQKNGMSYVWRSCITQSKKQIRQDCTRVSSSEGNLEVCTCGSNLCNGSPLFSIYSPLLFALLMRLALNVI
ncbi:hypothetical protein Aduo_018307 [Ancylostoma duodenale]